MMGLLDDAAAQSQNCMYRTWFWFDSLWDTGMLTTPRKHKTQNPRSWLSIAVGNHNLSRWAGYVGLIGFFQNAGTDELLCTVSSSRIWQGYVCRMQCLVLWNWCPYCLHFRGFFSWANSRLAAGTQCLFVLKHAVCALGFISYGSILSKRNAVHPLQDCFMICSQ